MVELFSYGGTAALSVSLLLNSNCVSTTLFQFELPLPKTTELPMLRHHTALQLLVTTHSVISLNRRKVFDGIKIVI